MHASNFGGGGDKYFAVGFFHGGIFQGEESFQGVNLSGEIIHCGNLREFLYNLFFLYMSCFLFSVSILHAEWLKIIVRGKFSSGLNCLEDIFMEIRLLHGGGARFHGIIKKRPEIK